MKIYISASLVNSPLNARVADALRQSGHEVFLPQEFCPNEQPHETFPEAIYRTCVERMEECDVGLLHLDCYGRDSAWECGWFGGRNKTLVGIASASLRFLEDWMLKGGIDGVIALDPAIHQAIIGDPILSRRRHALVSNLDQVSAELERYLSGSA